MIIIAINTILITTIIRIVTVVECKNWGGRPIILPSQSITSDSSSVQAGEEAHLRFGNNDDDGDDCYDDNRVIWWFSSVQAGEEVHLPVSYYDDDGDGVALPCYFLGLKDGHFWQSNCFRTTKNGTSGAKIKILRPLLYIPKYIPQIWPRGLLIH